MPNVIKYWHVYLENLWYVFLLYLAFYIVGTIMDIEAYTRFTWRDFPIATLVFIINVWSDYYKRFKNK